MTKVVIDDVLYIPAPKALDDKTMLAALDVRFDSDAGDQITIRNYLERLLLALWEEEESFSGKRPFGNSGWQHDLYTPLARAGFIDLGELDEDGAPYEWTDKQMEQAHFYVLGLIGVAFNGLGKPQ